jgi:CRP/FNR family cyclic AMP-dependent transcriptional regulator
MTLLEFFGWSGAFLTLSAYSMRNMLPLRCIGLAANVSFIIYGAFVPVYPMLVLHAVLLPLNLYRLSEILIAIRRMRHARGADCAIDALKPFLKPTKFSDGDVVFRLGDKPDKVYFLESGTVELPELGKMLFEGTIFGEMAYFTNDRERTTTAICKGECTIMAINEKSFMKLYRQHPEFGVYLIRLMAQRIIDGNRSSPELYNGFRESAEQEHKTL